MGLTVAQYAEHFLALLPRGRAWNQLESSTLYRLAEGMGLGLLGADCRAGELRDEVDPFKTAQLLGDWERVLGLPDECIERPLSTDERRATVLAKLASGGGQTPAYFVAVALALGFTVEIVEAKVWRCTSTCTDPLNGAEWVFVWYVVAALDNIRLFRCTSPCTDALRGWGNETLECALLALAPAHTLLLFEYVATASPQHLVYIYIDDPHPLGIYNDILGWPEGSGPGYDFRFPQTPNIDALAAAGVRFTNAQATAVCSPGRAAIQTGNHPTRTGVGTVTKLEYNGDLHEFNDAGFEFSTIASKLAAGNPAALLGWFGKIHLSNDTETEGGIGFGILDRLGPWTALEASRANHNQRPFPEGFNPGDYRAFRKIVKGVGEVDVLDDYSTSHWFTRALSWLTTVDYSSSPVLLYLPHNAVHSPFDEPPLDSVGTEHYVTGTPTAWRRQLAMMESLDYYLGQFIAALPPTFLEACTFVVMADNGPDEVVLASGKDQEGQQYGPTWTTLLDTEEKHVKQSIFRPGVRAELIVSGPGLAAPASTSGEPVHIVDVHETILDYFGAGAGSRTDGVSLLPLLHAGAPHPRHNGVLFSDYFMPNGDPSTIVAAGASWDELVNYTIGDEVNHLGVVYTAAAASGPGGSGAVEPGTVGASATWDTTRWRDLALEADLDDVPGGPDFQGRYRIVRRLGMPDRCFHLWRADGELVHPWELPGEEVPPIADVRLLLACTRLADLLADQLASYPGPRDCLEVRSAAGDRSTMPTQAGLIPLRGATGTVGWITATLQLGDLPGSIPYTEAGTDAATVLLRACIPPRNRLPIRNPSGFQGYQHLEADGTLALYTSGGVLSTLIVGASGVTVTDAADVPGTLPLA